jgi:hypothetical protein
MRNKADDELTKQYKRELFEKFNEVLRSEGFTEVQIAKIDTAVRRALNL